MLNPYLVALSMITMSPMIMIILVTMINIIIVIVIILLKHLMVLIGRDWATRSLAVGNYWRTASSGSAVKQKARKYNLLYYKYNL